MTTLLRMLSKVGPQGLLRLFVVICSKCSHAVGSKIDVKEGAQFPRISYMILWFEVFSDKTNLRWKVFSLIRIHELVKARHDFYSSMKATCMQCNARHALPCTAWNKCSKEQTPSQHCFRRDTRSWLHARKQASAMRIGPTPEPIIIIISPHLNSLEVLLCWPLPDGWTGRSTMFHIRN